MKLDTSSYYPKSPLHDEPDPDHSAYMPGNSSDPEPTGSDHPSPEQPEQPASPASPAVHPDQREAVQFQAEGLGSSATPDLPPTRAEQLVDNLSTAVSWLMSPLLMPVYGIVLVFMLTLYSYVPMGVKLGFSLIVAGVTIVVPALMVLLLKRLGMVHDLGLNGRKERTIPYIVTILCMGGTAVFLAMKGFPMWVVMFYAGGALAGLIEAIINNWWKISAHCAGIAGLCALLVHIMQQDFYSPATFWWLLVTILLSGLLGTARLWLNRHTVTQVLAGYAVGFCSVYFMMMIR